MTKFKPHHKRLAWLGIYIITTTVLIYFSVIATDATYRLVIQFATGTCFSSILFFPIHQKKEQTRYPKIKEIGYNPTTVPSTFFENLEQDNIVKIVEDATKHIALLDNLFLYKERLQGVMDKFYEWNMLFSEQRKSKAYGLVQPTEITLDKLIRNIELALIEAVGRLPKLYIEKIDSPTNTMPKKIICNVDQMTCLLVTAILRTANLDNLATELIKVQLYTTYLQIDKGESMHHQGAALIMYRAIAFVLSNANTPADAIPKVKSCYKHIPDNDIERIKRSKIIPNYIDPQKETIESIIDTHYGYLECPKHTKNAILLVLPTDIHTVCNQTVTQSPTKHLRSETPITLKEEADSMMMLMKFHDFACRSFKKVQPEIIGGTLLLLKQRFGNKQHISGELFYIRAIGITKTITKWIPHSPEPIYACLLYNLVRYTDLPLSYIEKNYDATVHTLVHNVLNIETHQEIEPFLTSVNHQPKKAADQDHPEFFVLYIKLAERLYDLHHAENYTHLEEIKHMAQETLKIDIKLAKKYLDANITKALEMAVRHAEAYLEKKDH